MKKFYLIQEVFGKRFWSDKLQEFSDIPYLSKYVKKKDAKLELKNSSEVSPCKIVETYVSDDYFKNNSYN